MAFSISSSAHRSSSRSFPFRLNLAQVVVVVVMLVVRRHSSLPPGPDSTLPRSAKIQALQQLRDSERFAVGAARLRRSPARPCPTAHHHSRPLGASGGASRNGAPAPTIGVCTVRTASARQFEDLLVRRSGDVGTEPLDVRSIRSIIATRAAAAGISGRGQRPLAAGGAQRSRSRPPARLRVGLGARAGSRISSSTSWVAQRRPEPKPRRHCGWRPH